ncbi:major facilitator superfamily transporter [Colletotrichum paranaense]|uniref:Major facilitator superfamily transporter n=1 Tax=Colletotrichum paranaense TaxID=1914294 RepID=A0ABQ9SSU1_9PEZI|nr:major facilitator superfamily transporter [Colletotrichum paranaense]KAK1542289.1 major facilitator superfamily transporter [Colletotrichum paranaense]
MTSTSNESPRDQEKDASTREAAIDTSVIATDNTSSNDSPPTSSSQASPTAEKSTTTPAGPPDGGLQAWLHILGSFFIYFNTWGLISSFGAFQAYYQSDLLKNNTAFEISTIGSLQNFLMVFLGFIIGPIYDLGYSRYLLVVGSILVLIGLILQAFCQNLWQFLLCQGLIIGLGTGCLSTLGVALPSQWFSTRLALANGIAANGSGVGGLVLPAMFRAIQPKIGFRWTVLVFALIALVTLGVANLVIKTSKLKIPLKRRPLVDKSVFYDLPFLLFLGACCLLFLGMYTPYVYVQSYALENHMASENVALYLLSMLNGASIVGRIIPNFFAPYIGIMNMIASAVFVMSIAAFCFAATNSQASLIAVTVVYGFFSGTFFGLQPTTFVKLTADKSYMGTRFGMAFTVMSVALLFGSPIAGALSRSHGYLSGWIWSGCCLAASGVTICISRGFAGGWKLNKAV